MVGEHSPQGKFYWQHLGFNHNDNIFLSGKQSLFVLQAGLVVLIKDQGGGGRGVTEKPLMLRVIAKLIFNFDFNLVER